MADAKFVRNNRWHMGPGGCQDLGGRDQPGSGCDPHQVAHRAYGVPTSLTNLKDYCWRHRDVLH